MSRFRLIASLALLILLALARSARPLLADSPAQPDADAASRSTRRAAARTSKPSRANRRAVARPIPLLAPVTTALPRLVMAPFLRPGPRSRAMGGAPGRSRVNA